MRAYVSIVFAFCAALVAAQSANNVISIPSTGLNVTAGQPLTISWTNPSNSTLTIKLQQGGNIQPTDGTVLESSVPASAGTATFTIPTDVNQAAYSIEIIDDSDPSNVNFSDQFTIASATAAVSSSATSSSTGSSSSASGSSTSGSTTSSSSASSTSSGSSSSSSGSASSTATSTTMSKSTSSSSSQASSTSSAAQATGTSTVNAGVAIKVQGGLVLAAALGFAAALL